MESFRLLGVNAAQGALLSSEWKGMRVGALHRKCSHLTSRNVIIRAQGKMCAMTL